MPTSHRAEDLGTVISAPPGCRVVTGKLDLKSRKPRARMTTRSSGAKELSEPTVRPLAPRVAYTLALAHDIERKLKSGEYETQVAAARALGVTPMRVSQILRLTALAPDIQEEILMMPAGDGRDPITERGLRDVLAQASWAEQRRLWREVVASLASGPAGLGLAA